MEFLRNPELKRQMVLSFLVLLVMCIISLFLCKGIGFLLCLLTGIIIIGIWFYGSRQKYKKIATLSQDLDRLLHQDITLDFTNYQEGELSILSNEIQKMTVRLREQTQSLQDEKIHLMDSIADISHQLKTPLTSMQLILSLLREPNLNEQRKIQLVRELAELMTRIDWLIASLLKLSRIDAGVVSFRKETINVYQMIQRAVEPLQIPMELKEQQFIVSATKEEQLMGDISWLIEAIGNILKNCMEHTPVGGSINVKIEENPIYTRIEIEDNGPGFLLEDLPHLFERFYKGKHSGNQSVGIGLALARVVLSQQNATIKAENRKEGGARFILRFYKEMNH